MKKDFLFLREYPIISGFNIGIQTPDMNYNLILREIHKMGPLTSALFDLSCMDNSYSEEFTIMRLYESILPQDEVYKAEASLINNDDNLALRVLYDPRIKLS